MAQPSVAQPSKAQTPKAAVPYSGILSDAPASLPLKASPSGAPGSLAGTGPARGLVTPPIARAHLRGSNTEAKKEGQDISEVDLPPLDMDIKSSVEEKAVIGSQRIVFSGMVLTAVGGPLRVPAESRTVCALFDSGLWLVSESHKNSPLVTSVRQLAIRQGFTVEPPRYVTPDVIRRAYHYADKNATSIRLDDNAVRRRIVETLQKGSELGASDIHIESTADRTKVEFRVDGKLRLWETWTQKEGEQVLSSIYSHSAAQSGSTANWLEPQAAMLIPMSGPDTLILPDNVIAVRCQWIPLADGGRYLDMRLQYDSAKIFGPDFVAADVDSLGFSQDQTDLVRQLRAIPGAMRVFSGPVNQGKTTTLRVMLNRRMAETNMQLNCLMIEDPPEGGVLGGRQVGVSASVKDEQRERSFLEVMRCALRLDPDIVMLGEMRDMQTATFAFRLTLTGRQVYTTLHVYSAIAIPQRLRDLGIDDYLVYDPNLLRGLICQRLMRTLCRHCRMPMREAVQIDSTLKIYAQRVRAALSVMDAQRQYRRKPSENPDDWRPIDPSMLDLHEPDLGQVYFAHPQGCPHCYQGRSGRTIIAEVAEADDRLMDWLQKNKMESARQYWLAPAPEGKGGITMMWHALDKLRRGEIDARDAEFDVGFLARDREVREVENRLGGIEKWLI
ncbi:MAG: Flp pilus assembly complex ATPase component TadA [Alphaproteobacteria bacterium]|nr:MAG: Flp pilus assembly complex ATPase component TadA [Alphaproteobacteria bacterium]